MLYPLFVSFISNNVCCLYCQELAESLFIHYFFLFFFFRKAHTCIFYTVLYKSYWKRNWSYARLPSSFPHHFLNKSARPLDMSYKHKTIITRTFLLTLDICDNKDLLWFYLWNPLNLNEKFFLSLFWISMRSTLSVMAMSNICEILPAQFQHFKNKQLVLWRHFFKLTGETLTSSIRSILC